jgi:hypothetical protein
MKHYPDPKKLALADLREEVARLKTFLSQLCESLSKVVEKAENEFGIEVHYPDNPGPDDNSITEIRK